MQSEQYMNRENYFSNKIQMHNFYHRQKKNSSSNFQDNAKQVKSVAPFVIIPAVAKLT